MVESSSTSSDDRWERDVLQKIALAAIQEQRRARQWGIFFKLLWFVLLLVVLFIFLGWIGAPEPLTGKHTAMVDLDGVIGPNNVASADNVIAGLDAAFKDSGTEGVILRIDSPGGSPVQAGRINDEIGRLRKKYPKIPIYAVVEDICASGAYYAAVATDKIYVDKASIVGSIGVLMDGFGFTGAMEKLGIERRLLTAGKNKGFLDPFSPLQKSQEAYAETMLEQIHQQFIQAVRRGRGNRLKETPDMFSGLVWVGTKAVQLGLADGFGDINYVARDVIKAKDIVDYTPHENIAERVAKRFGAAMAHAFAEMMGPGALAQLVPQ